jgi:N-methylhydantoinase B
VVDAMFGCLAQIVPDRMPAAGEGGNSVVSLGGRDGEGRPFVLVDMINGAWGARPGKDGVEGITNPSQNMSNTPVEVLEARLPVRIDAYGFAPDSGGPGRHRGGLGLVRSYRLLAEEAVLQLRADRVRFAPFGLSGGGPALPTENRFERDGAVSPLPGKVTMVMRRGDALHHRQAGGGGFGDPALRDYDRIDADLADGKVTAAHAERHYRVAVAGGRVDRPASDRLRAGS